MDSNFHEKPFCTRYRIFVLYCVILFFIKIPHSGAFCAMAACHQSYLWALRRRSIIRKKADWQKNKVCFAHSCELTKTKCEAHFAAPTNVTKWHFPLLVMQFFKSVFPVWSVCAKLIYVTRCVTLESITSKWKAYTWNERFFSVLIKRILFFGKGFFVLARRFFFFGKGFFILAKRFFFFG